MTTMKPKIRLLLGALCFLLMIFSIASCVEVPNLNSLGDVILDKIGLKPWSGDSSGFHYTIIYSLAIFTIGYLGITYFFKNFYPDFLKKLPFILLLALVLMPNFLSFANKSIKSISNGVDSIGYDYRLSNCNFKPDDEGNIIFDATLQFHNFSSKEVTFYIKYFPAKYLIKDVNLDPSLTAIDLSTGNPQSYTIPAKETRVVLAQFKAKSPTKITNFQGGANLLELSIFNDQDEKKFFYYP